MKQSLIKKISYIACTTMLAGAVGATAVYAANEGNQTEEAAEKVEAPAVTASAEDTAPKDETVYVLADANGVKNKVIVSDHIKNPDGKSTVREVSDLLELKNVGGDETFSANGGEIVWNANGNDIYSQGISNDSLPVDITVTYKLNGADISPAELAGKSGRVTIRFDYTNYAYEEKTINGEKVKIYVPFAAVTGLMLDNENFRNVEVKNGRAVNDGTRTVVIGTAFPGISESLGLSDNDKIEIPEYVEITADATDLSLMNTFTLITNEVFNNIDIDLGGEGETITEDIDKLSDAMNQLIDGTGALHDGLTELLEKSGDLADGVGKLNDGAMKLSDGAASANDGAAQLYDGSLKLSEGLDTLTASNKELTAGSEQVFESLLDMANTQLEAAGITGYTLTISNYSETLDKIIASLDGGEVLKTAKDTAMKQVTEAVEANRAKVEAEVTKAVKAQVKEKVNEGVKAAVAEKVNEAVKAQVAEKVGEAVRQKVLAGVLKTVGMDVETYNAGVQAGAIDEATRAKIEGAVQQQLESDDIKAQIEAATAEQMQSEEVKAQAAAALEQQMQSDEVKAQAAAELDRQMQSDEVGAAIKKNTDEQIAKLIDENYNSKDVQDKIKAALGQAKEGVAKLHDLKTQLDSYNKFYTGLAQYTEGVASAADGAKQIKSGLSDLSSGTAQLADGAKQLADGTSELSGNMPALTEGVTKLADGSGELADGINKFNDEGISKLISIVDGDLGSIIDRFNAVSDLSETYGTFSGGSGSVKFIYRTDEIEKS
ncbi:MAG: hypothetical protein IJT87_07990 [Ruminiclostridium sp.]|nr:hypothetical protein [Ruminiclostridium sp.]